MKIINSGNKLPLFIIFIFQTITINLVYLSRLSSLYPILIFQINRLTRYILDLSYLYW